jgi:hypothetical protein
MTNSDVGYGVGFEMLRAASVVYGWPDFKGSEYVKRSVDAQQQALFVGEYPFNTDWRVEVAEVSQADGIAVVFPNGDVYPLTGVAGKSADHLYVHEDTGVEVRFSLVEGKAQLELYNQTALKKDAK